MKFIANNKMLEFDLNTGSDFDRAMQFFKFRNSETAPYLNSLLLVFSKIKTYDDIDVNIMKSELSGGSAESFERVILETMTGELGASSFAYTFFDPISNFFNIRINADLIESNTDTNCNPEFVSFLLLHQIVHSVFGHFTRPIIQSYRERNGALTEKILDAQVNSFMIKVLKYKGAPELYKKNTLAFINNNFPTFENLFNWSKEEHDIEPDFDIENDFPSVISIFKQMDHLFDRGDLNVDAIGANMDSHELSMLELERVAGSLNRSVEEVAKMQGDSMAYLEDVAKSEGIAASDAYTRQTESESITKSILEIIKLRTILGTIAKSKKKKTYKKINRRRTYPGDIPMKGVVPTGVEHVLVGMDVSGSVSNEEIAMVKSHVKKFAKKHNEEVVLDFFVWSSGKIIAERDLVRNIGASGIDKFEPYSYGGTCLQTVTDFISEEYKDKKITFCNITDGYYTHVEMPLDIITDHYGILTVEGRESAYEKMHAEDNLRRVETIRAERKVN